MRRNLFRQTARWLARPPPCCSTRRTLSTQADRSRSCPYLNARIDATAGANADRDNSLATERLLAADVRRLWHPYTSATQPVPCLAVSHASGVTLTLEDGRELIDGMSSWWAAVHGYAVPELDEAASQFGAWAVVCAPMLLSVDLTQPLPAGVLEIISAPEVLAGMRRELRAALDAAGAQFPTRRDGGAQRAKVAGRLVKVSSWYDNEWGFSNRMLDTTVALMGAK
jgi:hypothetical protein